MAKRPLRLIISRDTPRAAIAGIYLITDDAPDVGARISKALTGGIGTVQFRRKNTPADRLAEEAREIRDICRAAGVTLIVNDDIALAKAVDADGVHLGQDDGRVADARHELGDGKIVGVSTHNLAEARRAEADGADYIGFGAMFPTASKDVIHLPGPQTLAQVRQEISIPIAAIGGITCRNAAAVIDAGADAVAVISAVLSDPAPDVAAAELRLLFNRKARRPTGSVLSVAGSDSGGGAGIQADIKTITLLGSYASTVITALTAQNTRGVTAIHPAPASFVEAQLQAVLTDIPVDVVKTGMLFSGEIIRTVAAGLADLNQKILVVDPVMVAKGGAPLMDRDGVTALRDTLIPLTYLLTPNVPEAENLTGLHIDGDAAMEAAARALHAMGARNVLLKGGHLAGGDAIDLLFDGTTFHRFATRRILTKNSHGTGCTTASAIAACLAQGMTLVEAVQQAKSFITAALRQAQPMGRGQGPVNHYAAARETDAEQ